MRLRDDRLLRTVIRLLLAIATCGAPGSAYADQHYSREVFFENSLAPGSYPYSEGSVSAPSRLDLRNGKLPVETEQYISGPNALQLSWQSQPGGGWDAQVRVYRWRNRGINWAGADLFVWMWSEEGIAASGLPLLSVTDVDEGHTAQLPLSTFVDGLKPRQWTRRIPLDRFCSASLKPFAIHRLGSLVFAQGAADAKPHTLYLDDIRIEADEGSTHKPVPPANLEAKGYERHIDLHWTGAADASIAQYVIYRSRNGSPFKAIGVQRFGVNRFADYLGDDHETATYQVSARTSTMAESAPTAPATASTHPMTDDELLTMVEEASFRYYWEAAEPVSGMALESQSGADDVIATGASGFGILAMIPAADRGFISRQQGGFSFMKSHTQSVFSRCAHPQ